MFSKKTETLLAEKLETYLKKINPDTPYWKGKHTWGEMVKFRQQINDRKIKSLPKQRRILVLEHAPSQTSK